MSTVCACLSYFAVFLFCDKSKQRHLKVVSLNDNLVKQSTVQAITSRAQRTVIFLSEIEVFFSGHYKFGSRVTMEVFE